MKELKTIVGIFAVLLFATTLVLSHMTKEVTEVREVRHTREGMVAGGAAGLATWLLFGGVGIATGGIAFGLGAIGLTAVGTGVGGLVGAANTEVVVITRHIPLLAHEAVVKMYMGAAALAVLWLVLQVVVLSRQSK
jgi:hypothetical protein